MNLCYSINKATLQEILNHLERCDDQFIPPLSSTVILGEYAYKITQKAERVECYNEQKLIALVAFYMNRETGVSFITNVSVEKLFNNLGIARKLVKKCEDISLSQNIFQIKLEVNIYNSAAINLYNKLGYTEEKKK